MHAKRIRMGGGGGFKYQTRQRLHLLFQHPPNLPHPTYLQRLVTDQLEVALVSAITAVRLAGALLPEVDQLIGRHWPVTATAAATATTTTAAAACAVRADQERIGELELGLARERGADEQVQRAGGRRGLLAARVDVDQFQLCGRGAKYRSCMEAPRTDTKDQRRTDQGRSKDGRTCDRRDKRGAKTATPARISQSYEHLDKRKSSR